MPPASSATESYSPDNLIAGGTQVVTRGGTMISGETAHARGTLLGQILFGTATPLALTGNVGGGTVTMDVTTPLLADAQVGSYLVKFITFGTAGGGFEVFDPKGNSLGLGAVGTAFANQIKFSIADGTPDFQVGDRFSITVAEGSKKYRKSLAAAVDGSQYPKAILAEACNAAAADKDCLVYEAGEFNQAAVTYGTGHTADSVRAPLRDLNIHLKAVA